MVTSRKPLIKSSHSGLMMNTAQVQILWERHKVWKKNLPLFFQNKVKDFYQIFVAFSEYLKFSE